MIKRAVLIALGVLIVPQMALAQSCPAVLARSHRLVLVTANGMQSSAGTMTLYTRGSRRASWRRRSAPTPVRLGERGMAWGAGYQRMSQWGEPVKHESDWRAPAGFYRIGRPFGFGPSKLRGYVRLRRNQTLCVDDLKSRAYNTITTVARVGRHVHGEHMGNIYRYRHGLFIRYPSNYSKPAGSCLFIHVWLAPNEATAGCIAMPEARVIGLQNFAQAGAVIGVLPKDALNRFKGCLPGVDAH